MKNLKQSVRQILAEYEKAGIPDFDKPEAQIHLVERRPHWELVGRLYATGIESAWTPEHPDTPGHEHEVLMSLTTDGSVGGSNESLLNLLEELSSKTDNLKKLAESGSDTRILFVWIDGDTAFEIARPLSGAAPHGLASQFGLPTITPNLDPAITEVWIVHDGFRLGWRWDGRAWSALEEV